MLWNRDLVLSAVQWLAETQVRVGIAAKRPEQLRLSLQDDQQTRLFLILVLGLPLLAALLGVGVGSSRGRGSGSRRGSGARLSVSGRL